MKKPLHSDSQYGGHGYDEPLGNGRHGQCYRNLKHIKYFPPRNHAKNKNQKSQNQHQYAHPFRKTDQYFLQRRGFVRMIGNLFGDFTYFSFKPDGRDYEFSVAARDNGAFIRHIGPVRHCFPALYRLYWFDYRHWLARERRFVYFQIISSDDPAVRRNAVPEPQSHNIAYG